MKILITGATGFIGQILVKKILQERNDSLHLLTRNVEKAKKIFSALLSEYGARMSFFAWEPSAGHPPLESLSQVNAVINLLGEGVADRRWTTRQKSKIYYSRILGTRNLVAALNLSANKPQVLVSTSAVGYYRHSQHAHDYLDETASAGAGFLTKTCQDWEAEALLAQCRCCIIRVGGPLGPSGGILGKMLPAFRLGLGGTLGDGEQYFSWIHVEDLARIYLTALDQHHFQGIYNGTAPHPVTNKEFTQQLAKILHRPAIFSLPRPLLEAMLGEMISIAFHSQIVLPQRLLQANFTFHYPDLNSALAAYFKKDK